LRHLIQVGEEALKARKRAVGTNIGPVRLALLASAAGLVTLGSSYILGEVSAVAFAVSLFILICATEART